MKSPSSSTTHLLDSAAACLAQPDPAAKCAAVAELSVRPGHSRNRNGKDVLPGRPTRPILVHPRDLPRRALGSQEGHGAFVHAICHIEFTAINLALDAAVRFSDMPATFYSDWISVAAEEAQHFLLLSRHLNTLGYAYGDFDAHNGLWDMARRTSDDVLRRMALVPRVMEARGLDVTPSMMDRLQKIGDQEGARILRQILHDEVKHVRIGSRWFTYVCNCRGLDSAATFLEIVADELGTIRATTLNYEARVAAGFSKAELEFLSKAARSPKTR